MKTVITYGTFDLFHTGHLNLLKRARALGDRLIVGVTSNAYDQARGKLNVVQTCEERMENVRATGLADLIIIEEEEGQKIQDILHHKADIFAIGSDWTGKFDYLNEYCRVIYLERTRGVSTTSIREQKFQFVRLGLVGCGQIASRFLKESKYVSGIEITSVFGRNQQNVVTFAREHEISHSCCDYAQFLNTVDAVYIAVPHRAHFEYAKQALLQKKHILCEKPLVLSASEAEDLYNIAEQNNCVLLEAIKTAYAPAFIQLIEVAKSGIIGAIKAIDATFTKLVLNKKSREYDSLQAGGALTELGSYPFLAIAKLLGTDCQNISFITAKDPEHNVDIFTRALFLYKTATATANVGIGVKKEGDLCIAGTKGYIYVPAPWWKTEYFEIRHEDIRLNRKVYAKFEGDGLRYELSAFLNMIQRGDRVRHFISRQESLFLAKIIEKFLNGNNVTYLGD